MDLRNAIQKNAARVAMPSWRSKSNEQPFWTHYDAVIASEVTPRGRNFEVWTFGETIGIRHSLEEAKALVEEVYGPLQWSSVKMPKHLDIDPYWGPTYEFTDPKTIYVVDHLPRL